MATEETKLSELPVVPDASALTSMRVPILDLSESDPAEQNKTASLDVMLKSPLLDIPEIDVIGLSIKAAIQANARKLLTLHQVTDYGAVGDNSTNNATALTAAFAAWTDEVVFPSGIYVTSAKPAGFTTRRRAGAGIVRTPDGDIYPDDDVVRFSPNMDIGDMKVTISRNNANLNADAGKRGFYFAQEYSSSLAGAGQLFGYVANVKRTGGSRRVVPAQLNGYALNGSADTVWGVATEAWSGDATTEPTGTTVLVGAEFGVISQYHANSSQLVGADVVFKNKADGASDVLHGSAGTNGYNLNSVALRISAAASRPASGAYTGWNTGIYFTSGALDESTARKAIAIDMTDLQASRMYATIKFPNTVPVVAGSRSSTVMDGWRYMNDGGGTRIEFVRGIEPGGSNTVKAKIDLGNNANTNAWVMTQAGTRTTIGATGGATALPANPLGYFDCRLPDGTAVAVPYYTRGA